MKVKRDSGHSAHSVQSIPNGPAHRLRLLLRHFLLWRVEVCRSDRLLDPNSTYNNLTTNDTYSSFVTSVNCSINAYLVINVNTGSLFLD
jgi:hypothetical protein